MGGAGSGSDACPGCTTTTVEAYGHDMVYDSTRNLIYVAADGAAQSHPNSTVTVDVAAATVASSVPVGDDPQSLALSDDASALWVGLAGDRQVRRLTPGATPVPGPAYSLPPLLSTGEDSVPGSVVVLPGTPSSIAVSVYGNGNQSPNGRGVFILDGGQPRAGFVQPPEVAARLLTNGPPGYLLGAGNTNDLVAIRLSTVGATTESYGGLFNAHAPDDLIYRAGLAFVNTGEVVDLTNPDAPVPAGHFVFGDGSCKIASRSTTRTMLMCSNGGPILYMLDNTTFTRVGTLLLRSVPLQDAWLRFLYLGGDAVAILGKSTPLQIIRAPMIGSPP